MWLIDPEEGISLVKAGVVIILLVVFIGLGATAMMLMGY